ncbi:AAA family ATPase [Devosia sediminis]|uniref:AAA family ATPase n=1 Tax=Devosia sediminis TaxID=2798801 RepID=A0A934MLG3_9HYPH|nr:AAA family ATPase [Devosia sediminis]MBJ3786198.1 AAA family ATPase [Devosia sediminis]
MTDLVAGQILLLSGHPGSGKTTTAEALAHRPGVPKVHLHSDDFWGYIKTGLIQPWLPESHRQNQMIMDIAAGVAGTYARNGYAVVLDGVIRPWTLPHFEALGLALHYVVLRTSANEAVARCVRRGGDSLSDPDVVASLHAEFSDLGEYEGFALDVGGRGRDDAVDRVLEAMASGAHLLTRSG